MRFAEQAKKLVACDRIDINGIDLDRQLVTPWYGEGHEIPEWSMGTVTNLTGIEMEVVRRRAAVVITPKSLKDLERSLPGEVLAYRAGLKSFLAAPLLFDDRVIGSLNILSRKPNAFTKRDTRLAQQIADQIAGAIANAQLHADVRRNAHEREVLAEIGRIISSSLEIDEVYERFADQVRKLIPFDRMVISHVDGIRGVMISPYVAGMRIPEFEGEEAVSISGFIEGEVFNSGAGVLFQPADAAEVTARWPGEMPGYQAGLRSQIGVPLVSRNEVMGILEMVSKQPRAYSQATLVLAQRVGA